MQLDFGGNTVSTIGEPLKVTQILPDFTVEGKNGSVSIKNLLDKPLLISVVPDINTRVCSIQTKKFNEQLDIHNEINFVTISVNTVEEQSNWCAAENVKNMQILSDVNHHFANASHLLMEPANLLARSVWVIDTNGQIIYSEILKSQSNEPDYDKVLNFLDEEII
ncbi:thiol peroxidase [Lactobacillus terrae]|uniref:thiol peroxidase n=1 Tax=Lactobacillus terrae TaxID=2269374 RepID=UPI000C1B651E|nr:peroxiredoxin [Lactobacillus terrae]